MPNRHGQDDDYRYGYQGSESDDETYGTKGSSYTTHFRQLDTRIGRWLSIDPMAAKFPHQSPYVSMDNNPVWHNDPFGDEIKNKVKETVKKKQENVDNAQVVYDKLVENHDGDLSKKDIRKYERKSGINKAKKVLKKWQGYETKVDQMMATFKTVNPEEYERLNNLTDIDGDVVDVYIGYTEDISKRGPTNYAVTSMPALIVNSDKPGMASWSGQISGNAINITIFRGMKGGTMSLANEFGDIDYLFTKVTPLDPVAFDKWVKTANPDYGRYDEPGGAGEHSFEYEEKFKKQFKKHTKGMSPEQLDKMRWIILK